MSSGTAPPPANPPSAPIRTLGDFTLLTEIGRGGMGVVYKARQDSMGRLVALKVLPSFAGLDPEAVARFRREAEAAGRLSHPGIVPVYAVGEADGVHYFAMELVEGPSLHALLDSLRGREPTRLLGSLAEETSLADVCPALRDPPGEGSVGGSRYARSCAWLALQVCEALAIAHENKIVHRDLKPSNILIHRGGRPVLVDYGLSRDEVAAGLTRSGEAIGTPAYMAPEQAQGRRDSDARVDVWGIGALLYELLALRPPFEGGSANEIMRKIVDEEPLALRKHNERVPVDLETIVHTCLQKDPAKRYPAIEALLADLRQFLCGEAVHARRPSLYERTARFVRRHRRVGLVSVVSLCVAGLVAALAGMSMLRERRQRGLEALREARRILLQELSVPSAREAYGRAEALLGDSAQVQTAQRAHLHEAIDELYDRGQYKVLEGLAVLVPPDQRDPELARKVLRLRGLGQLGLGTLPPPAPQFFVRRFAGGQLEREWRALPADRELQVGEYLLRSTREGHVDEVQRVTIRRDATTLVALRSVPVDLAPDGFALVSEPAAQRAFWCRRGELTRAEYQQLLPQIRDEALRKELQTGVQLDGVPELPVANLSFRQARIAAAMLGGHLPTHQEFLAAASCGLDGLAYPWGQGFDPQRVVADPDRRTGPDLVSSLPEGESPGGIRHLVGNVAEFLAPVPGQPHQLAGGHWLATAKELRLDAAPHELSGPDEQLTFAGLRLCRFPQPGEDAATAQAFLVRKQTLLAEGGAAVVGTWEVLENGRVNLGLALAGNHAAELAQRHELPLVTEGFIQAGTLQVRDGHGEPIAHEVVAGTSGQEALVRLHLPAGARKGQRYRYAFARELVPLEGLSCRGDAYVLEIPTRATGHYPVLHEVVLPSAVAVESCEPEPALTFAVAGKLHLVFEHPADQGGLRAVPLVIRFRRDGLLTDHWPAFGDASAAARDLLDAINQRDAKKLAQLLAPSWRMLPSELDYERLVGGHGARVQGEQFLDWKVGDVTAVGPVVTVDLTVRWHATGRDGESVQVEKWPMQLRLLHEGERWLGLSLAPKGSPDQGTLADGVYRHALLKVDWQQPAGARLVRRVGHLCTMQVACELAGVRLVALGEYAEPGRDKDATMLLRLSAGESELRPGSIQPGPELEVVGPADARRQARVTDWLFTDPQSRRWSRERWYLVPRLGRRWFLLKAIATGDDPVDAKQRFAQAEPWLRQALAGFAIR